MTDLVGQSVDRYHILEQLGEGGMATVYKAYDTRLERDVAVKVIRTEKLTLETMSKSLKRFEREAKSLGKLTHPNIVPVSDYGEYEGKPYLVMPYLPGGTLKEKLGKPIPWQEAIQLLLPIAEALDYAHDQNMIHRDVKPANILLTQRGQPMLTDFGIAKILDLEETQDLTGTSAAIGTPEYMAPEQATAKSVDKRADIYSLGIVLYEMLTGRKPFVADTPMAVLIKQATEPLPRPKQFAPNLPDAMEKVLFKALAKQPENRYQSMEEFAAALKGLLAGKSASRSVSVLEAPRRAPIETATIKDFQVNLSKDIDSPSLLGKGPGVRSSRAWLWAVGVLGLLMLLCAGLLSKPLSVMLFPTETPSLMPTKTLTPTPIFTWTPEFIDTPIFTLTPIFTSTATPLLNEITDSKGVSMRLVAAGIFRMGSERFDREKPIHDVYLDTYYMDTYEVTNKLYKACVDAGICVPPQNTNHYNNSEYENHPVVYVNWNMSKTYCEWRGAQLPTEAQWEKAARGTDERTFPWGEEASCSKANISSVNLVNETFYRTYCVGDTTVVGSYESGKSPYGLYDMIGNVWEWVSDWYSATYYQTSPSENPLGPTSGQSRVLRGGSWNSLTTWNEVRSFSRQYNTPTSANDLIGFRCARLP
jgi:serine/threonine protein kinase